MLNTIDYTLTMEEMLQDALGGKPVDAAAEPARVEDFVDMTEWALLSVDATVMLQAEPILWEVYRHFSSAESLNMRRVGCVCGLTALIRVAHPLRYLATELRAKLMWGMPLVFVDQLPGILQAQERDMLQDLANNPYDAPYYLRDLRTRVWDTLINEVERLAKESLAKEKSRRGIHRLRRAARQLRRQAC